MADPALTGTPLIAAAPLATPGALPPGEPTQPLPVVTPMLPARQYPAAGRRILARIAREEGATPPVEALYGYESMRVVLEALRAAGKDATDRVAVIDAAREHGPDASVIGRYRFDRRGDTTRSRLALYDLEREKLEYRGPAPGSGR
jgi:branched-chain amino acid transport system substrate-binding protein